VIAGDEIDEDARSMRAHVAAMPTTATNAPGRYPCEGCSRIRARRESCSSTGIIVA
jgi:hypothetical protein